MITVLEETSFSESLIYLTCLELTAVTQRYTSASTDFIHTFNLRLCKS